MFSLLVPASRVALDGDRRGAVPAPDLAVLAIGLLETLSWIMLVVAAAHGLLSVVGVLVSLYPVVTVILARAVYAERLRGSQAVGVLAVLAGVTLLAAF